MRYILASLGLTVLAACGTPVSETIAGAAPTGTTWRLESLNETPFAPRATLEFLSNGSLRGDAPCNSYSADQTAPLPWFEVDGVSVTRRACADLDAEARFLDLLTRMDFAEIGGDTLLLSNADGENLFFRAE